MNSLGETPLILLAAGESRRMGRPKGLLEHRTGTWLEEQIRRLVECGIQNVILVLGFDSQEYFNAFPKTAVALRGETNWKGLNLRTILNTQPKLGPFSSLQCGLREIVNTNSNAFVLPVDTPVAHLDVWMDLVRDFKTMVAVPRFGNQGGHPVLLRSEFINLLLQISPDNPEARLDYQIRRLDPHEVKYAEVKDPQVIWNLNSPEKYSEYLRTFSY